MEAESPRVTNNIYCPLAPARCNESECRGMETCSPNDSSGHRRLASINNDSGFDGGFCEAEVAGHSLTTDSNKDKKNGGSESVFDLSQDNPSLCLTEDSEFEGGTQAKNEFSCHNYVVQKEVEFYEQNLSKLMVINEVEVRLYSASIAEYNVEESEKVDIVQKEVEPYEQLNLMNDVGVCGNSGDRSQTINQSDPSPCDDGFPLRNAPSYAHSHDANQITFRAGSSIESASPAAEVTKLDAVRDFSMTCTTSDQVPCDTDSHLTNMVPDSPPHDSVFLVNEDTSDQTSVEIRLPLPKVGSCDSNFLGTVEPAVMVAEVVSGTAHLTTKVLTGKKTRIKNAKKTAKARNYKTKEFSSEIPTVDILLNLWSGQSPVSKFVLVWPAFLPKEQHTAHRIVSYSGKSSGMKLSVRGRAPNFYALLGNVHVGGMNCETIEIARDELAEKILRDLCSRCCLVILSQPHLVDGSSARNVTKIHRHSEVWIDAPSFGSCGTKWDATIEIEPGNKATGPLFGVAANGAVSDTFKLKIGSVIDLFEREVKTGKIWSDTLHLNLGLSRREATAVCNLAVQRGLLASFRGTGNDLSVRIILVTTVRERLLWAVQRGDDCNNFTLSLPGTYNFEKMLNGEIFEVNFSTINNKVPTQKLINEDCNKSGNKAKRSSKKSNARTVEVDAVKPDWPAPPKVVLEHRSLSPRNDTIPTKKNICGFETCCERNVSGNVEKPNRQSDTSPVMEYTKNLSCTESKETKPNLRAESMSSLVIAVPDQVALHASAESPEDGETVDQKNRNMAERVLYGTADEVEVSVQIQPSVRGQHSLDFREKSESEKLSLECVEKATGDSLIIEHTHANFDFTDGQPYESSPINDDGCNVPEKNYNQLAQLYEQLDARIERHYLFSDEVATTPIIKRPLDEHFFHPVPSCNLFGRGLWDKKHYVSPTVHVCPQSSGEHDDTTAKSCNSSAVNPIAADSKHVFPKNSITACQLQKLWTDSNPLAKLVLVHRSYLPKQSALQILTFSCEISGMPFSVKHKDSDSTAFIGNVVVGMTKDKSKKEARKFFSESLLQQLCSCCCFLELKKPNLVNVPLTVAKRVLSGIEFWRQLARHKDIASKSSQCKEKEVIPAPIVPQTLNLPGLSSVDLSFQKEITQTVRQFHDEFKNCQKFEEELVLNLCLSEVEAKIVYMIATQHNLQAKIVGKNQARSVVIKASTTVRNELLMALRCGETDNFDLCLPGTYSIEKFAAVHPNPLPCRHSVDNDKSSSQYTGSPPADHLKTDHPTFIYEDIEEVWSDSNLLPSLTLVHRNYPALDASVSFEEDLISYSALLSGVSVSVQKDSSPKSFTVYLNGKPVGRSCCRLPIEAKASIFADILPKLCSRCSLVVLTKPPQECILVVSAKELLENDIAPTTLPSIDSNNVGYKLLKMMGWSGGGLGREAAGRTEPLLATESTILPDRRGLGFPPPPPFASPTHAKVDALLRDFTKGVEIRGALYNKIKFTQGFSKEQRTFIKRTAHKYRLKHTILNGKNSEVSKPLSVSQVIAEMQGSAEHEMYVPGSYDVSILYNRPTSANCKSQTSFPTAECRSNTSSNSDTSEYTTPSKRDAAPNIGERVGEAPALDTLNYGTEDPDKVDLPLHDTALHVCSAASRPKHSVTVSVEWTQEPYDLMTARKISGVETAGKKVLEDNLNRVQVPTEPVPLLDEVLKVWSTADPLSKFVIVNCLYEETKEHRALEIMSYSATVSNLPFSVLMTAANECSAFLGDVLVGVQESATVKLASKVFSEKLLEQFCTKCCFLELRKPLSGQKYLSGSKVLRLKDGARKMDKISDRECDADGSMGNEVLLEKNGSIPSAGGNKTTKTFDEATDDDHLEISRLDRASKLFELQVMKTIEKFINSNETGSTRYKHLAFALPLSGEKMRVIKTVAEKFQLETKFGGKLNAERFKIKMSENIRVVLLGLLNSDKQFDDFSLHLPGTYNIGNILTGSKPSSDKDCTEMPEGTDEEHEVPPSDPSIANDLSKSIAAPEDSVEDFNRYWT